jgi:hypothetical protein
VLQVSTSNPTDLIANSQTSAENGSVASRRSSFGHSREDSQLQPSETQGSYWKSDGTFRTRHRETVAKETLINGRGSTSVSRKRLRVAPKGGNQKGSGKKDRKTALGSGEEQPLQNGLQAALSALASTGSTMPSGQGQTIVIIQNMNINYSK